MNYLRVCVQGLLGKFGYRLQQLPKFKREEAFERHHARVKPYTMTSIERQQALYDAVNYITSANIPGDFVECGVWKGGSSMLAALTLLDHNIQDRTLYLYDTFTGMSEPTDKDINLHGRAAHERWVSLNRETINEWDYASLEEVEENMRAIGYPKERIVFVKGKVEETIPGVLPGAIALLRLDTDWYESTRHELEYLFDRLVPGGVLILDDYGHWKGARDAVDEYFTEHNVRMFLHRIDYTGRIGVKS